MLPCSPVQLKCAPCFRSLQLCKAMLPRTHASLTASNDHGMQMVALELFSTFNCFPVFLGSDLKQRYYKGT